MGKGKELWFPSFAANAAPRPKLKKPCRAAKFRAIIVARFRQFPSIYAVAKAALLRTLKLSRFHN